MANRTGYEVTGLNELVRDLQAIGLTVEDLKDAFAKIAAEGAALASRAAPKVTGRLAASIRGNRAKSKAVVTVGRAAVPYAGPINYGWPARNIDAALFLQSIEPVLGPRALERLEEEITEIIRRRGLQ